MISLKEKFKVKLILFLFTILGAIIAHAQDSASVNTESELKDIKFELSVLTVPKLVEAKPEQYPNKINIPSLT